MDAKTPIRGKLPLLTALLALTLVAMWLLGRCSHQRPSLAIEYIRPTGDTVAIAIELSPTGYTFTGDSVSGFDYEMLCAISEQHNLPMVFCPFAPMDYALKGLREGKYDMMAATIPASLDLKNEFLLTDEIIVDRQVLVRLKSDSIPDAWIDAPQLVMLRDTVWITDSSPYRERLSNLSQELGDTIFVMSDPDYNAEQLVLLTALGEIKQAIVNESVARSLARDYPDLDISTPISLSQFQPWVIAKNRAELRDSMNVWIRDFKQTKDYAILLKKYFSRVS